MAGEKLIQSALRAALEARAAKHVADPVQRAANLAKFQASTPPSIASGPWYHGKAGEWIDTGQGKNLFLTRDPNFAEEFAHDAASRAVDEYPNVMPFYVGVKNPFDYENPEHLKFVQDNARLTSMSPQQKVDFFNELGSGSWHAIEHPDVQKVLRNNFDSFFVREMNDTGEYLKNLGVYDPKKSLKSATGNLGTFDPSVPRIDEHAGGEVRAHRADGGDAEIQSNGQPVISNGRINWGETPADIARAEAASRAMSTARSVVPPVAPVPAPRRLPPREVPMPVPRPADLGQAPAEEAMEAIAIPQGLGTSNDKMDLSTDQLLSVLPSMRPPEPKTEDLIGLLPGMGQKAPAAGGGYDVDLTPQQRDLIIRTIAAEANGKTPEESQAIGHVILNRLTSGRFGETPEQVLFAKNQFEPWSDPRGSNYPMRHKPGTPRYEKATQALDAALANPDITGGATMFWAPKAQAALGRLAPSWGRKGGMDIGETRFHRDDGGEVVEREGHADGEAVGDDSMLSRGLGYMADFEMGRGGLGDVPPMDPSVMGQNWSNAVRRFRENPLREGEATVRPLEVGARDVVGGLIAGNEPDRSYMTELRRRAADAIVGSTGLPGSGTVGFGLADLPLATGIPLQAADLVQSLKEGDYTSAALNAGLPAAFWARKPIADVGRRAVDLAREYAPQVAGALGVGAALAPSEARALMNMRTKDYINTPPWMTQDVPDEQQIVRMRAAEPERRGGSVEDHALMILSK